MTMNDGKSFALGAFGLALVGAVWLAAFFYVPIDSNQGVVYRIMYLHVPAAFTAFASALVLFIYSIKGLRGRKESTLLGARASVEVGLLFTAITLATGSIWGKPTWGTWWTWDARLTTTFMLALLYAGWLLLHSSMAAGPGRVRACAVLGILIFADVPIIYQSVNWWRTLHQPQSMLRPGGSTMDPQILMTLILGIVATIICAAILGWLRRTNLALRDEVEQASFEQMRS